MSAVFGNSRRLLPETKPNGLCADAGAGDGVRTRTSFTDMGF